MNLGQAQTALYNAGNLRIHAQGQLGFHTNLINDAAFDTNLGLAGFYGSTPLTVSGAYVPLFFDVEIANDTQVFLQTGIDLLNNVNFVVGDFTTPRNQPAVFYNFLQDAFYTGDGDISKVDGYAAITNQQNFTFPIGDSQQLRPLILNASGTNPLAKCAYFFEDPNRPSSFSISFDTQRKPPTLGTISTTEFWRLEGSVTANISISWNERSNMAALTNDVRTIIPVGWSKATQEWVSLGGTAVGDLTQGFVSSANFVPDDYEIITFGNLGVPEEVLSLDNYLISPNGDGMNDFLVIPELVQSPNNMLRIYDRFGLKVFEKANYTNEFNGISNIDNLVIDREQGLPVGVYFYILSMDDLGLNFQGFLYLTR
jgi:gliding motility-associated-like protein